MRLTVEDLKKLTLDLNDSLDNFKEYSDNKDNYSDKADVFLLNGLNVAVVTKKVDLYIKSILNHSLSNDLAVIDNVILNANICGDLNDKVLSLFAHKDQISEKSLIAIANHKNLSERVINVIINVKCYKQCTKKALDFIFKIFTAPNFALKEKMLENFLIVIAFKTEDKDVLSAVVKCKNGLSEKVLKTVRNNKLYKSYNNEIEASIEEAKQSRDKNLSQEALIESGSNNSSIPVTPQSKKTPKKSNSGAKNPGTPSVIPNDAMNKEETPVSSRTRNKQNSNEKNTSPHTPNNSNPVVEFSGHITTESSSAITDHAIQSSPAPNKTPKKASNSGKKNNTPVRSSSPHTPIGNKLETSNLDTPPSSRTRSKTLSPSNEDQFLPMTPTVNKKTKSPSVDSTASRRETMPASALKDHLTEGLPSPNKTPKKTPDKNIESPIKSYLEEDTGLRKKLIEFMTPLTERYSKYKQDNRSDDTESPKCDIVLFAKSDIERMSDLLKGVVSASCLNKESLEKEKEVLEHEIDQLTDYLNVVIDQRDERPTLEDYQKIEKQLEAATKKLDTLNAKIQVLEQEVVTSATTREELTNQLAVATTAQQTLNTRIEELDREVAQANAAVEQANRDAASRIEEAARVRQAALGATEIRVNAAEARAEQALAQTAALNNQLNDVIAERDARMTAEAHQQALDQQRMILQQGLEAERARNQQQLRILQQQLDAERARNRQAGAGQARDLAGQQPVPAQRIVNNSLRFNA